MNEISMRRVEGTSSAEEFTSFNGIVDSPSHPLLTLDFSQFHPLRIVGEAEDAKGRHQDGQANMLLLS
jgi:hypothetical protein